MICMNETTKDLNMCDGCYYLRVITLVITKVPSAENLSMSTYVYNFDLLKMLFGGMCWLCGESRRYILEFHHVTDKRYNIASMMNSKFELQEVLEESEKCALVCRTCHMLVRVDGLMCKDSMKYIEENHKFFIDSLNISEHMFFLEKITCWEELAQQLNVVGQENKRSLAYGVSKKRKLGEF